MYSTASPWYRTTYSIYQGSNSTSLSSAPRKFLKSLTDTVHVERNPLTHYFAVSSLWEKRDTPYNCQGFLHFPYFIDTDFFPLHKRSVLPRSKSKQYNRRADRSQEQPPLCTGGGFPGEHLHNTPSCRKCPCLKVPKRNWTFLMNKHFLPWESLTSRDFFIPGTTANGLAVRLC